MTAPVFFVALESDRGVACRTADSEVEVREFAREEGEQGGADLADAAARALAALGYDGRGIALGLGSDRVFAAEVSSEGLPRKGRRAALLYRLEEHLPLDAERLTAGFLPPSGGRTFGIAVETAPARALLDRLAEAGVRVEAVCPTALLALWQMTGDDKTGAAFVLLDFANHIEVFHRSEGQPVAWHSVPADPGEVSRAVQVDLLSRPVAPGAAADLVAGPLAAKFLDAVAAETGLACRHATDESSVVLAARAAGALLAGDGAGWVDLARHGLGPGDRLGRLRRPIRTAVGLALALLVAVIGGSWWRAARYDAQTDRLIEGERTVFRRLYPNHEVPLGVRRWLASEAARLGALSGTDAAVPQSPAALETLRKAAEGLPDDLRFRLVMVRVEPTELYLEGQARSHSDAEAVAQGIAGRGFAMEPPRTESLAAGGVTFTLVGQPAGPQAPARAKAGAP